eukprot:TRINITY_DN1040_c0_g1_i1.p1 TRINITY_DN1040_c0_g1~~TRINITY_DN1040_c0_g1_i1.p1  ORF type:complete len:1025 (+),score=324.78 TRINITY_DN1040_c0_g1_i1:24-3077(+)
MDLDRNGQGVTDFILMDSISEDAILKNITERLKKENVYTYIGEVVVAVNPYKELKIYDKNYIDQYKGRYMYQMPPHIYALAENAYRNLRQNKENQCILISGESGAGKTVTSKKILNYIAAVSKSTKEAEIVKDMLLESNPLLEAFGNAKTARNDNSSRFGKYMEIQFDYSGIPVGGKVTNYLLEKSRVVQRAIGERSFHIFYQMLTGLTSSELQNYHLESDPKKYKYLSHSECFDVKGTNDKEEFKAVIKSMKTLNFTENAKKATFRLLAAILHLGNIEFTEVGDQNVKSQPKQGNTPPSQSYVTIKNSPAATNVASLLGVNDKELILALTQRTLSTGANRRASIIKVPLDYDAAIRARDALAKALYSGIFDYVVEQVNIGIKVKSSIDEKLTIGILDIYGFEIFNDNGFEQFCINFCNEKLQQYFIELTLKTEQEEYVREGIKWENIEYFNNKVICDLIEKRPVGIFPLLDECCLIANGNDTVFLEKLDKAFGKNDRYASWETTKKKEYGRDVFMIRHYAGDVYYRVPEFVAKNQDTLFRDQIAVVRSSSDKMIAEILPPVNEDSNKRPLTSGTKFKNSLNILLENLNKCAPHYVRCIKSNEKKQTLTIDDERVRHQIRYLGLLENVRVRRAGFCNRQEYERFLARYKMIAKETWPLWNGNAKAGVQAILNSLKIGQDEFRMGKTKVFIRNPKTLFFFEDKRAEALPKVVTLIQKTFRGYLCRKNVSKQRAAMKIQLAYRRYRSNKWLIQVIKTFRDVKTQEKYGKNTKWPEPPNVLSRALTLLRKVHNTWRCKLLISTLKESDKAFVKQKIVTYDIFHEKKKWNVPRAYDSDYLVADTNKTKDKYELQVKLLFQKYGDTDILFSDVVDKLNRRAKLQKRVLVVTEKNIYKQDPKGYKIRKLGTPLVSIVDIQLSKFDDRWVVIHCSGEYRDLAIRCNEEGDEKFSELVTTLVQAIKTLSGKIINVTFFDKSVTFNNSRKKGSEGKPGSLILEKSNQENPCGSFKKGKGENHYIYY